MQVSLITSPVAIEQHELEALLQKEIFTVEGMDRMRPLLAVKAQFLFKVLAPIFHPRSHVFQKMGKRNKIKEKKQERIFCVARDWCGAFGLFIVRAKAWLFKKTRYILERSYPFVEAFAIEDFRSMGVRDLVHFVLNIDDNKLSMEWSVSDAPSSCFSSHPCV